MSAFITLDSVTCRAPDGHLLFENLTFALGPERVGLVGRNGVGKTTLLRLILGETVPAAGSVSVLGRVALLPQIHAPPPNATLADVLGVSSSLAVLDRIEWGEGEGGDLDAADWTLPQRLERALVQVGLAGLDLARPPDALSGGQITRAALAALLLAQPDVLLLDEPTNNLDVDGRAAVALLVEGWGGGVLAVSHDRDLLRRMDRIVELSGLGARTFGGNFDLYAARKAEEDVAAARDLEAARLEAARIDRTVQAVRERQQRKDAAGKRSRLKTDMPKIQLGFHAERAESTGARQGRLADRLRDDARAALREAEARVERVRRADFDTPPTGLPPGKPVLAFDAVSFAWPGGAPLLSGLSFSIFGPERVALKGANGSGKSTLIGLAAGRLAPAAGRVVRGVAVAVLDQRAALLDDRQSLVENFRRLNPEADENAAHAALARFLFRNAAALKPAAALSGGERLRAALACVLMAARPPGLLILDEPTNHLDLDSIAALEAALRGCDGAFIIASHDETFLAEVGVGRVIDLDRGRTPQ